MRTKITVYGEIAGKIWMPAVECTKAFHLELNRIPRNSKTCTYPGIAPQINGNHLLARRLAPPHE